MLRSATSRQIEWLWLVILKAVVEAKRQQQYQLDQAKYLEIYGGEPGRHLNPDQLEQLRQQNLVAVHTTRTQPDGRLYPVAAYNRNDPRHVPRCSIHTSINHPVASHMWGNFENKDFTVVSPLAEIVAINGIPDVLNSVDTYFSVEPTEGNSSCHQKRSLSSSMPIRKA